MKLYYLLGLIFFSIQLQGQSVDDWTWYNQGNFYSYVYGLDQDANGDIWLGTGTKVIKFDGVNWVEYDVMDAGLPWNSFVRSIDSSLGDVIWISTFNRVLELNITTNQWTLHDPTNGANSYNGQTIKVESADKVWWTSGNGLWEYDGVEWTFHNLNPLALGLNINASNFNEIEIDNNKNKWVTTSSSICIDSPCFTPTGVIQINDTDTILYDGDNFGFPQAHSMAIDLDSDSNPIIAFSNYQTNEVFYSKYNNNQWSTPVSVPYNAFLYGMELGNEDQMYLFFKEFIAVEENGVWDVIPLDPDEVTFPFGCLLTPENDIYIAGRYTPISGTTKGVLGYLPHLNYRVRGLLYSDYNLNGTFDGIDQGMKNQFVQTVNQDRISFSNNDGDYSLSFFEPNTYEIEGLLPMYHSYEIPVNGIHSVALTTTNPKSDDNNFGFEPDTSAIDLSLSSTAINGANPGFQTCYMINVKNNAPRLTDGELIVNFDDLLTFESSNVTPSSIDGNQLTFDLQELDWLEIQNIKVCFLLPPDPNLIEDTLKYIASVIPTDGMDLTMENNVDTLCRPITGPYDPNFIGVHPAGVGVTGDIPLATTSLEYTIHFQNIGSDTARNVVISNPIDSNLNILSLNVLGSSHEYEVSFVEEDRLLQWTFLNINLPDSSTNEIESNGFIKYKIDLAAHEVGSIFTNVADIYFDFNLPITTNTTINTLIEETVAIFETPTVEKCDYELNLVGDQLQLQFPILDKYKIEVYDLSGRKLKSTLVNNTNTTMALEKLPSGFYVVSIVSKSCVGSEKIFIN